MPGVERACLEQDGALVTLVPHTTSTRKSRFEVAIESRFLRTGAFDTQNLITIPTIKLLRKIGTLPNIELSLVEVSIRMWLGI